MSDLFAWLIIISCCAAFIAVYAIRLRTARYLRFEAAADGFYEHIPQLLDDENIPESVVDMLQFLNRHIADRRSAPLLVMILLRRGRNLSVSSKDIFDGVAEYYDPEQRLELSKLFFAACVSAMFAMTYRSAIFGWIVRRLVLFDLNIHQNRAPDIVASLRKTGAFKDDGSECPVAA